MSVYTFFEMFEFGEVESRGVKRLSSSFFYVSFNSIYYNLFGGQKKLFDVEISLDILNRSHVVLYRTLKKEHSWRLRSR